MRYPRACAVRPGARCKAVDPEQSIAGGLDALERELSVGFEVLAEFVRTHLVPYPGVVRAELEVTMSADADRIFAVHTAKTIPSKILDA